jgi:hypothetical protein
MRVEYQLNLIEYQLNLIEHQLNLIEYQLNLIEYQLNLIKHQLNLIIKVSAHLPSTSYIFSNLLLLHSPTTTPPSKQKNRPLPSITSPLKLP